MDDTFRGTSSPVYAAGEHALSEGYSGAALKVTLGGIDDAVVHGMSGGWRHSFALSAPAAVTLSFRDKVTQAANYEEDELSEMLVTIDGLQPGLGGTDYVVRLVGDGNGARR